MMIALLPVMAACTNTQPSDVEAKSSHLLPEGPASVTVALTEYRVDSDASSLASGRTLFRARNAGAEDHQLVLTRLPEGLPPLSEQFRSGAPQAIAELVHQFSFRPGEAGAFAADLFPGRYGLMCFLRGLDGVSHAARGMHAELTVHPR